MLCGDEAEQWSVQRLSEGCGENYGYPVGLKCPPEESQESNDEQACLKCGVGSVSVGNQCVGVAATCAGLWGDKVAHYRPQDSCQCNDKCKAYGNCCMDHNRVYTYIHGLLQGSKSETCADKGCPQYYNPSWKCQCNGLCTKYGNCCEDSTRCSAGNV